MPPYGIDAVGVAPANPAMIVVFGAAIARVAPAGPIGIVVVASAYPVDVVVVAGIIAGAKAGALAPDAVHAGIADGPPYGVAAVRAAGASVSVMVAAPMPVVIASALPANGVEAIAVVPSAVAGVPDALAVVSE